MDSEIMVETLPLLGMCNLCLDEGAVKSMILPHEYNGKPEIYSELLLNCFSIDMSTVVLGDLKRVICDMCVGKLRDCLSFKEQALDSLRKLEVEAQIEREDKMAVSKVKLEEPEILDDLDDDIQNDIKHDNIRIADAMQNVEVIHNVDVIPNDDDINDDFNDVDVFRDDDDHSGDSDKDIKTLFKSEKETEGRTRKTRSKTLTTKRPTKLSKLPLKKAADTKDTEAMLQSGLFPFKIKKNRSFSCAICPEKSTNLDDIKSHIVDHNKTNIHLAFKKMIYSNSQRFFKSGANLRCKICTTDISDYEELKQHVENCTRLKYTNKKWSNLPFKLEKDQLDCPVCKKTFLNYVNLNTHMNIHYPNYICENCGKAFASKARLRGHMRTHEVGSFPCRYCELVFDRVTKRENHVSKEHKSGVRYACKRCNISLTSFYARQKHLAEVHNEELKRYKCKACPQSYITPGHLSSHVRRDHLNERNHKCDKCDLAFYTKNALKMHMIKHDGERIHTCPVCQKSYQRKKTLREHLRIHNNDKRFVCPVCGRAFTQKCTLKGHLKVHERKFDVDDRVVQPLHSI